MIMNQTPYPISFEREMSQALVCRYGEEMRQYVFKPDIDVSGLSCLLQIAKTDGTFTENGVEVHTDPDTGECTLVITIPQQATVVKGLNRYSICVYGPIEGEDHLLYSAEGHLWVDDDLITDEMIQSVAEVNGLVFPQDFLTVKNLVDIVNYVKAQIIDDQAVNTTQTWSSSKLKNSFDSVNNSVGNLSNTINAMKTGFDGVEYPSPVEMVQGCDTKLQNEIDSMEDAVNAANEMFVEDSEPAKTNVSNIAFFTKTADTSSNVSSGAVNSNIWLTSNSNFDSYVCILESDADIYVDPADVAYVALCYGYEYTSKSGNTYYCSNPARKRNIDGNLPTTAETAISLSAGDIIVITVTKNKTVNVYGLETNYDFSNYAKSKILEISSAKKPCAIYNGTTTGQETERVYIYIPCGVGYIRFNFAHYIYAESNANVWVIHPVYAVDDSLTTRFALTTSGEFECALRIDGAPDFMGGSSHGSEIMQSIEFFVDGAKTDPDDITSLTTFDELRIVEQSKLFDPRDETTYAALHGKEYIFTKDKLIINQTVVWQTSETLGQGYLAMLPVAKTVTSKILTDNNYDPISFPAAGITADGVDMALSWDDTVGFSVRFSKDRWDITGSNLQNVGRFLETDNNGGEYNKQYFICCSAGSVSSGDMWKTTTQYVFEINK